jgi:hypothetical protein
MTTHTGVLMAMAVAQADLSGGAAVASLNIA